MNVWLEGRDLQTYADHIFKNYDTPRRKVSRIAYVTDNWKKSGVPNVVAIDTADVVRVNLKDPVGLVHEVIDSTQRVATISHRISPEVWETQLALL